MVCRDYWYPVYAYIRRSGYQGNDTEDLVQDFFAYILRKSWFNRVDQAKGKFRSFLLISLTNFLRDHLDHKKRLKRGWAYQHIPLDMGSAESHYAHTEVADAKPAELYEVEWANAIVDATLVRLESEYVQAGKEVLYRHLKTFLTTDGDTSRYGTIAEGLGTSVSNIKVGVHRLRKEYGSLLREEVAKTVAGPADVDGEMRHLRAVFAGR